MIRIVGAVPIVFVLAACGVSTSSSSSSSSSTTTSSSTTSAASTSAAKPAAAAPRLGAPASNAGKMNYKTIRIGCMEYVISPVLNEGDPIDEILVGNACNRKKLPWAQAKAIVTKGVTACLSDVGYALVDGPNIEVRREGGLMGECSSYEKRYKG